MAVANTASTVPNYQGAPDWPQTWARTRDGGVNQTAFDANQLLAIVTDHTELVARIRLYDLPLLEQDLSAKQLPWPYSSGAICSGVNAENQAPAAVWMPINVPTNTGGSRVAGGYWAPYGEVSIP